MDKRSLAGPVVLYLTLVLAGSVVSFAQGDRPCLVATAMVDEKFVPGQVWSFKSREFEPDATVTILKIESLSKIGEIIHVRVEESGYGIVRVGRSLRLCSMHRLRETRSNGA